MVVTFFFLEHMLFSVLLWLVSKAYVLWKWHARAKVCHVEFLRSQPLGTNDSLIIRIVKNASKLTLILSLLQCWKATDTKTGWWLGKSQDFVVTSSVWRKQSTLKENQHCCYSCDYNTRFNQWECGVLYITTTMCMLPRVRRKFPHTFETSAVRSRHF